MPRTHIIQAGDWIGALAKRYGFSHWGQIWDDPLNDALRKSRGAADLLMIGDALAIPDAPSTAGIEVASGTRAVFVLRTVDVLRLRVSGVKPLIEELGPMPYELRAGAQQISGTLTEDGQILELPLHDDTTSAQLSLMGQPMFELAIGGLGPASEGKGAYGRLQSLGYTVERLPVGAPQSQSAGDPLTAALVQFQRRHGLAQTGELDAETQAALVHEYGA